MTTSETGGSKDYRSHDAGFIIGISSVVVFVVVFIAGVSYFCFRTNRNRSHSTTKQEETGMEKGTLNGFPVITYAEAKQQDGRSSGECCCSVCLVDYGEEDGLRILPLCGHLFHAYCVDPWLQLQPNCPLCRSSIYAIVDSPC